MKTPVTCRRPLEFRLLPLEWRERLFAWKNAYRDVRRGDWDALFRAAELALRPGIVMHDLVPSDWISRTVAFTGCYEAALSRRIVAASYRGGLMVDVGANMGYFSLLWAGAGEDNRVVAFEAAPRNVELLRRNVARNRLEERIAVLGLAAGNHQGDVSFDPGPEEQTGWGGISSAETATSFTVRMVRLDEQLADADIELLKIDTEGADTLVLLGCAGLLQRQKIRTIFFEQNLGRMEQLGLASSTARTLLKDCGYACVPLDALEHEWMATRPGQH